MIALVCIWLGVEARGDPVEDAICFDRDIHRIVVVEGLYLLYDKDE